MDIEFRRLVAEIKSVRTQPDVHDKRGEVEAIGGTQEMLDTVLGLARGWRRDARTQGNDSVHRREEVVDS